MPLENITIIFIAFMLSYPPRAVAESAGETYRARFFISGMLMRASIVCGKNWMGKAKVGLDLISTPEMRDLTRAYPQTTKKWLQEGAANFNDGVMKDGIPAACAFANEMLRKVNFSINKG